MSPPSPAQGNRCSSIVHLGRKKVLARARQVAPQATPPLQASMAHSMLRCSHSAVATFAARIGRAISFFPPSVHSVVTRGSLCPPNPSRFRLRSIVLNWGQPPLIVRLACGSRGRRSVTVFACYVTFFCSRPYSEVWQHSLLSLPQSAQQPHIINPKESLPSLITLRSAHSATLH